MVAQQRKKGLIKKFDDDFYRNFLLDDVRHQIDEIKIMQSLNLLRPPKIIHGISDTLNVTDQQNYFLYTSLMFWLFFIISVILA